MAHITLRPEIILTAEELAQAQSEQEAIDWAAATVYDLCEQWGHLAVIDWANAWKARQDNEAKQREFFAWDEGNCHFDEF